MDWLIFILHTIVVVLYIIAPVVALLRDIRVARRRRRSAPSPAYVATLCTGIAIGTSVSIAYAVVAGGHAGVGQIALASYFAASLLLLLRAGDSILRNTLVATLGRRVYRFFPDPHAPATPGVPPPMIRRYTGLRRPSVLSSVLRVTLLFGIGLPYILAAGLTYRPKVISTDNPKNRLGFDYQNVEFDSTDGTQLSGWWIAALSEGENDGRRNRTRSTSTVLICPGPGVGMASALPLVTAFVPHGYNVLMLDFRAHGKSEGQVTSFGDLERRDVLGAANWLLRDRPEQSRKLFGVGIETGGAALIGAAADPSEAGQSINAIAVYGGFNSLRALAHEIASDNFLPPLNWLMTTVGIPLASIQTGAQLAGFAPANEISALWPRPVMIINGASDRAFPMELGRRLFESAVQPRLSRWVSDAPNEDANSANQHAKHATNPQLDDATNEHLLSDEPTSDAVRKFFNDARPIPVI